MSFGCRSRGRRRRHRAIIVVIIIAAYLAAIRWVTDISRDNVYLVDRVVAGRRGV